MESFSAGFVPLIIIGALVAFLLFWSLVVTLVSRLSGWQRLATDYEAVDEPSGTTFGWQSLRFGSFSNYSRVINITPSSEGLHLQPILMYRMGHKPLLIPWDAIEFKQVETIGFIWWCSAEISPKYGGKPTKVTFHRKNVITALQKYSGNTQ